MEAQLKLYNTLSRKKEVFQALNPPFVGLYVCGPTVYDEVHLGNLRQFTSFDIVYRYLSFLGYKVRYVRNITDVGHLSDDGDEGEDKIERKAKANKIEPMEIVQKYTNSFHHVAKLFNLIEPSIEPSATGHIVEQIEMVQRIIDNGYAYEVNGSVYFDVKKYLEKHDYGQLSGRKVEDLLEQTRDNLEGGDEKRFFADFGIWKAASPETIMKWNSPWGVGVPGWHLECSVMSTKYLGQEFDIHGGGMDLKFPHHECEIAQSVGADGKAPVRYWMHGNMLTVNGDKMSKSKGNAFLPMELFEGKHELLNKGFSPMVVRFFMLQTHYSSTLDFSNEALEASEKGYARLMNAYKLSATLPSSKQNTEETDKEILTLLDKLRLEMNDDFNTPKTIAVLFDLAALINKINDKSVFVSEAVLSKLQADMKSFVEDILGLHSETKDNNLAVDKLMELILEIRSSARENKDWPTSDKIRDHLAEAGIKIKDSKDGASWTMN
ncbi:MAG: cysteine--tRNA ligase [Chitinophagales bacterium]|nr:cysteine--tRNA ligase [Chitinophagales bacterium]